MKKKLSIFLSLLLIVIFFAWYFHFFPFRNPYARIPIHFSSSLTPYVEIEIENQKWLLTVDLGSDLELGLKNEILEKINHKNVLDGTIRWSDVKGNEYTSPRYHIPRMKMHSVDFSHVTAHDGYTPDKSHLRGKKETVEIGGTIGLKLLGITQHLLLDFDRAVFFLLRSRKALPENYRLEKMVEIPFENRNNRIIFSLETDVGLKRFLLDTGATNNLIRPSFLPSEIREKTHHIWMSMTSSTLAAAHHDFGETELLLYNFPEEFDDFDGILGMEFCRKHVIYLDLQEQKAWITP